MASWIGLGTLTIFGVIAAWSLSGNGPAAIVLFVFLTALFLIQGTRLEHLLHGRSTFGSLKAAATEGDLVKGGGVIRLRFRNQGRRAEFHANARWLDSDVQDFGYSPWDIAWSNGDNVAVIGHDGDGYLLPARVVRNHGGTHTLYQSPQSSSETPKHKSLEDDQPHLAIRIIREKPEAEAAWIVGFEVDDGEVRPVIRATAGDDLQLRPTPGTQTRR